MKTNNRHQSGQSLAHVAILMVVLLGFAALAIDGGRIYLERRRMQNAADAGALAGAYEICFGTPAQWEETAENYATEKNGADEAYAKHPDGQNWVVNVQVTKTLDMSLARVIGMETTPVGAVAEAACAKVSTSCQTWPIGFRTSAWENVECDENFLLWSSENDKGQEAAEYGQCLPTENGFDCDIDNDGESERILDGRAWLDFSAVLADGAPDPCDQNGCGTSELDDFIEGETNQGVPCRALIEMDSCAAGDSGVIANQWTNAGAQAPRIVFIPLYDNDPDNSPCTMSEDAGTQCGQDRYHIVDLGCVQVVDSYTLCDEDVEYDKTAPKGYRCLDGGTKCCDGNKMKVIEVKVACDAPPIKSCFSKCGSTTGEEPGGPGDVVAVSLIK